MTLDIFLLVALLKTNDCLCKTSLYCVSGVPQLFNWCTATVQLVYFKYTVYKLCTTTLKLCTAAKQVLYWKIQVVYCCTFVQFLYCKFTKCILCSLYCKCTTTLYNAHAATVQCTCCVLLLYIVQILYCNWTLCPVTVQVVYCNCTLYFSNCPDCLCLELVLMRHNNVTIL